MLDTDKYDPHSPKTIHDIVGNTVIWKNFYDLIQSNNASHTILVGPPGCGKSLFLRIALSGFITLVVDCTANFGLRDVRESIRTFARGGLSPDGKLRWVIFKHADSLTADTQAFLRRMLETTSTFTRFIFECRDAGAITEPIVSRCSILNIHAPDKTEALFEISRRVDNTLSTDTIHLIVEQSQGNMRSAILEALARRYTANTDEKYIGRGGDVITKMLSDRPTSIDAVSDWISWAIRVEEICRVEGLDLRDVLKMGWTLNPKVSYYCSLLSRLGGTSSRIIFMTCIAALNGYIHAEKI
jgi:replication-associated recombination protein RarA